MDSDLYDEFGNFIGDASDSDADSVDLKIANATALENGDIDNESDADGDGKDDGEDDVIVNGDYKTDGDDALTKDSGALKLVDRIDNGLVETVVVDPTFEGVDEPVIKPQTQYLLEPASQQNLPETIYSKEYMKQVAQEMPSRMRSVAVCGPLHSGKTSLVDELIEETHPGLQTSNKNTQKSPSNVQKNGSCRHLDTHKLEMERGISIFSSTASLLLQDLKYRSYLCHVLDTPGHPDFYEDRDASLQMADSVLFVVDVLEGLTYSAKNILTQVVRANLPIVVVLNKIDRLVLELRLPPSEFHAKIRSVLADINAHIYHNEHISTYTHETLLSPLKGNVVFASRVFGFSFSLHTWALLYSQKFGMDAGKLALLLWGDVSFANGRFSKSQNGTSFVQFVVDPLYKLITQSLVFDSAKGSLATLLWDEFRVSLPKNVHTLNPQLLLRTVFRTLSQGSRDLVNSIVSVPTKQDQGKDQDQDQENTFLGKVSKLYSSSGTSGFSGLARIYKGTLRVGQKVCVLADASSSGYKIETVSSISIPVGWYNISCDEAYEGQVVVVSGLETIGKNATLLSPETKHRAPIHSSKIGHKSVYKVAVEPEIPSDLPRLVRGLQHLSKCYISAVVKLEESGEHVILAPGELYLDCFLHDLRHFEPEYLSIKVSDPMVRFAESCVETSATRIPIQTPNGKSEISVIAEPITDKKLLSAIEQGQIKSCQPPKVMAKILKEDFHWDALAARSVWAFGPSDMQNPSILLDDSLEEETDKNGLRHVKESIMAGFHMGANEGPLCDEPVRRTKFKILDAVLDGAVLKNAGQVVPMTRNAVHCGLMTAAPRLLEPMYKVYVTCTSNTISAVHTMLEKRRGWVIFEKEVPGTKLFEVEGIVPVIDSPGLDTDIRLNTQGQAFCTLEFAKWNIVPGDPLDADCHLPAMQPVPRSSLARDFVMKTRKRKGLSGEPTLQKYVGQALYSQMKQSGIIN